MMRIDLISTAAALLAFAAGPSLAQPAQSGPAQAQAQATLKDQKGQDVGIVTLAQFPGGVLIHGELANLPPGWHAIHVHEIGRCEPPFESAGGHLSAPGEGHGLDQPRHHAGDLPNIWVGDDGTTKFEMITTRLELGGPRVAGDVSRSGSGTAAGAPAGAREFSPVQVLDQDGGAIVVHAQADDYRTDPAGASGDRIACGTVQ
jgi:Cu-Zn family superoxide dismutase